MNTKFHSRANLLKSQIVTSKVTFLFPQELQVGQQIRNCTVYSIKDNRRTPVTFFMKSYHHLEELQNGNCVNTYFHN
jgi:hypothetical protein